MKLVHITIVGLLFIYVATSKYLFDLIFKTSERVIDELFHLPQGLAYCHGNFSSWDPKITTLPGLYLVSTILLYPFNLCSNYNLRFVNLLASFLNVYLFAKIKEITDKTTIVNSIWTAFNIALLPPLYFFSFIYYTDVLSITSVLCMLVAYHNQKHVIAAISGVMAILMRQTNVVWIGMCLGNLIFDIAVKKYGKKEKIKSRLKKTEEAIDNYSLEDTKRAITTILKKKNLWNVFDFNDYVNIFWYSIVLIGFIAFVILNGSIVVGDKSAHEAVIHLPQIFYFTLFYLIFSFNTAILKIKPFCTSHVFKHKTAIAIILISLLAIVHFNTIVHPYLLADNRHYTFYIWNRFYGRYPYFKYAITVVYYFGFYAIYNDLVFKNSFGFIFMFLVCTTVPLVLQKMIEVRYFLLPFIILRLRQKNISQKQLLLETIFYLVINGLSLSLFFSKEIMWSDFEDVQRLIW